MLYKLSGIDVCAIKFQSILFKIDLKYLILSSLISRSLNVFLIFDSIKLVFIKANTAKWLFISVFIIPPCTSKSLMVLVSTWPIIIALDFVTFIGLFMKVKRPFRKNKLRKSQTFLCSEYSEEFILFILRSPTKNKGFFMIFTNKSFNF